MSMLTHEQMRDFIATHDFRSPEDVQRALKGLFAETLQAMLDGELETHLGYPKHQAGPKRPRTAAMAGTPSRSPRNTARCPWRSPATATGASPPSGCPRIRPRWSASRTKSSPGMRGGPTRDIQAQLADLYGVEISPALVSNITDKLLPRITEWPQRPLAACDPVVFLDAIPYKVREDGRVVNKAAYMVVGIDLEGYKDVLGMWIGATNPRNSGSRC